MTFDYNTLSPAAKAEIDKQMKENTITQQIETYGAWAGIGKEIGVAAREGLTAVKDVTLDLSESELGKTVMLLIVWKVAGIDMLRILIGFIIAMIATIFVVKSYMRSFATRKVTKSSGFFLWRKREYEDFDASDYWGDDGNRSIAQIMHPIVWLGIVGISFTIMFA